MSSNTHKQICENFLKFYKGKCREQKSEADSQVDTQRDLRLLEDMYDRDDLVEALAGIRDAVVENVEDNLEQCTSLTLHVIKQLYLQTEGFGETLGVDISELDNGEKLQMIAKLSEKQKQVIAPIHKGGASAGDALVSMKINDQSETNERVSKRHHQLATQYQTVSTEHTQLTKEIAALKASLAETNAGLESACSNNESEEKLAKRRSKLASTKAKNEVKENALQAEVLGLQNELSKKVVECKQYNTLKGMIQKKNKSIRELKEAIIEKGGTPEAE